MASTTDIPPVVGTSPASAPLLEDLHEEEEEPTSTSSTTAGTATTADNGRPSTSYSFSRIGLSDASTASGSSYSSSTKRPTPESTDDGKQSSPGVEGTSGTSNTTTGGDEEEKKDDSMFECNICLDPPKDAVVSMCGHLFCWPCIHHWMNGYRNTCPVCKSSISKEKVIPLYGRGGSKEDPRTTAPPRPAGQRTEPEQPHGFQSFTGDGSFHMSFGIGAFPFGFFTSTLNFGDFRGANVTRENTRESEEDQFLSTVFLYVAIIFLAWLAMA